MHLKNCSYFKRIKADILKYRESVFEKWTRAPVVFICFINADKSCAFVIWMLLRLLYYVTSLRPRCLVEGPDRLVHRILVLPEHFTKWFYFVMLQLYYRFIFNFDFCCKIFFFILLNRVNMCFYMYLLNFSVSFFFLLNSK